MMKISAVQSAKRRWSRRYVSKLFVGTTLGMAAATLCSRPAAAAEQPVYYTWEGYDDPEFFSGYVGDNGGLPIIQTFIDEDEALARLRKGLPADVVHPCADTLPHWRRAGVVVPIDTSRLSNWQNLFEPLKSIPSITADDQQWLVPVDWGTTSIIYRADLVDLAEESYNLLWDQRYAGKLALGEDATESVIMAALAAGISDPFNMSDVELSQLRRRLIEQRALLRYYWSDPATIQDDLRTGALVASSGWSDTYLTLKKEGIPVKYMRPKEGILSWCCGLALTASGSALDQAYELIDALIGPEAGRWLANRGIAHSNRATYELLGAAATEEIGLSSDPAELLETSVFLRESARILEYQRMFDEVRSVG